MQTAAQRYEAMDIHGVTVKYTARFFRKSERVVRDSIREGIKPQPQRGPRNPTRDILEWIVSQIRERATEEPYLSLTVEQFTGVVDIPATQSTDTAAVA